MWGTLERRTHMWATQPLVAAFALEAVILAARLKAAPLQCQSYTNRHSARRGSSHAWSCRGFG
jgi:hypothetical protein